MIDIEIEKHYIMVREFQKTFGQITNDVPTEIPQKDYDLRINLIKEEFNEVMEAFNDQDYENLIKEYADLIYVIHGYFVATGENFETVQLSVPDINPQAFYKTTWYNWKSKYISDIFSETFKYTSNKDLFITNLKKNLVDCYIALVDMGMNPNEVFEEVHRANMSKLTIDGKVLYNDQGKVMKSDQYKKANVKQFIKEKEAA